QSKWRLKNPEQVNEQPRLLRRHPDWRVNLLGPHEPQVQCQRIEQAITGDDLMAGDARAAFGVDAEVVVVQAMPDGGAADVFVIVSERPIVLFPRVTGGEAHVPSLVAVAAEKGRTGIVRVFAAERDGKR